MFRFRIGSLLLQPREAEKVVHSQNGNEPDHPEKECGVSTPGRAKLQTTDPDGKYDWQPPETVLELNPEWYRDHLWESLRARRAYGSLKNTVGLQSLGACAFCVCSVGFVRGTSGTIEKLVATALTYVVQ